MQQKSSVFSKFMYNTFLWAAKVKLMDGCSNSKFKAAQKPFGRGLPYGLAENAEKTFKKPATA